MKQFFEDLPYTNIAFVLFFILLGFGAYLVDKSIPQSINVVQTEQTLEFEKLTVLDPRQSYFCEHLNGAWECQEVLTSVTQNQLVSESN